MKVVTSIGLSALLASSVASAQVADETTPHLSVRWSSPMSCPDDAALLRSVETLLGAPLAELPPRALAVSVSVVGEPGAFSAKASFTGPSGSEQRYLEHADCAKLSEGIALMIALAIDPEGVKARQGGSAPPEPAPAAARLPAPAPPSAPMASLAVPRDVPPRGGPPPAPARAEREALLSVLGFAGEGVLPGVSPGVGLELGLRWRALELQALGRYWLPRSKGIPSAVSGDLELQLLSVGVRACSGPRWGALRLKGCVGVDVGDLSGSGHGVDNARSRHARYSALSAGLRLVFEAERLMPFVGMEAGLALERAPFGVFADGRPAETFRPETGSVSGLVGLIYAL